MIDSRRAALLVATALIVTACGRSVTGSAASGAVDTPAPTPSTTHTTVPATPPAATPPATTPPAASTTSRAPGVSSTSTATSAAKADPGKFGDTENGSYYFTSPSAKFHCAILTGGDLPTAGCHGPMPPTAPRVPGSGAPDLLVAPNAIEVTGSGVGQFVSAGDPRYYPLDGSSSAALPYGSTLEVNDLTCRVDEKTGVTCESDAGHGFTVSDTAFKVW